MSFSSCSLFLYKKGVCKTPKVLLNYKIFLRNFHIRITTTVNGKINKNNIFRYSEAFSNIEINLMNGKKPKRFGVVARMLQPHQ